MLPYFKGRNTLGSLNSATVNRQSDGIAVHIPLAVRRLVVQCGGTALEQFAKVRAVARVPRANLRVLPNCVAGYEVQETFSPTAHWQVVGLMWSST